jgi:hypothetical protein
VLNPAIQDYGCYSFVAHGAYRTSARDLDVGEDIEVLEIERKEIPQVIESGWIKYRLVVVARRFAGVFVEV